ncbi:MAG: NAD(+)/NADH kinase [Clostridiales bacterium]|nr:NAD(+)/NADH kinase [Clostridiales bacterium]
MKIGVLGNKNKVKDEKTVAEIIGFLEEVGYQTVRFFTPSEIDGVDVLIVLGGDGAILHSAVIAARKNIKIIGINYGNLGFLTEYEKDERARIKELLSQLEKGNCRILKRSLLQVEVLGQTFYALNEIALQRDNGLHAKKSSQILRLQVDTREGSDVIAGDGLLFCTPTGSTAYSLSAGGAILTPEVPVYMMTPICAFSMRTRPIVFADCEEITVKIVRGKSIVLCDGVAIAQFPENTEIRIKKAPFTADFPVREGSDFFAKVRNKLNA